MKIFKALFAVTLTLSILAGCSSSPDPTQKSDVSNPAGLQPAENSSGSEQQSSSPDQTGEIINLLKETKSKLIVNISGCEALRYGIVQAWGSAINEKYADFNDALSALFRGEEYKVIGKTIISVEYSTNFREALDSVESDHEIIKSNMSKLSSYDIDNKSYDALLDLYSEYSVLYGQVLSPTGSYLTFTEDTNDSIDAIEKAQSILDVVWEYDD